ncbi:hypothetical protein DYB37_005110 [Aphanomyces astaci]|uniref:RGS domain-containing protein n=3 Tax=Aphanomyces astaci TaxID=112090 RepID=A0A3R6XNF5_APHAT|nr:hypothetical protein DYB37_005110 [Aphanomyces astaci]
MTPLAEHQATKDKKHIQAGNALVEIKYTQPNGERKLVKAATESALRTSLSNPAKYRRQSICSDLHTNLSMAFTVDVLAEPVTHKLMIQFADKIPYAPQRLLFWADAQHLRTLPSSQYTDKILRKIYDKFLSPSAATPICVPTGMLKVIRAAFNRVYSDAQALCLRDLEKDVFPRFRRHKLYSEMLVALEEKPLSKLSTALGALHAPQLRSKEMRESFQSVLTNEVKLRYFKSYCVENMTLENLMFHLDVEDAKRLPNQSFVQARARKIIDTYIRHGAKMHIHLRQSIHMDLIQKLDRNEIDPTMFVDSQYVAMEAIKADVWPKFR